MSYTEEIQALAEIYQAFGGRQQSLHKVKDLLGKNHEEALLDRLTHQGYATVSARSFALLEKGLTAARQAARAVAVLKVFCVEILGLTHKETDKHIAALLADMTPALLEKYCILIGHAHNHNILAGPCCAQAKQYNAETVTALNKLPVGETAQITYVQTSGRPELLKLYDLGIYPGRTIRIQQIYPTYIVVTERGRLALDGELAKFIFVQQT